MVKHRSMKRHRTRSRSGGKSRARSMRHSRRSRSMRGGNLSGDSSYSTLIASSSDNSDYLAGQSGDFQQNVDRNNSSISGEGKNINMSQFKGLVPPGAYYGGKKHRRRMRGGNSHVDTDSTADVSTDASTDASSPAQDGGRRRRRRRMRGGNDMQAMNPDTAPIGEGMYDPPKGPDSTPTSGGTRRKRRGGGIIATAALPFGLFGLQKYFQGSRQENGSRRHSRRRRH